MPVVSKKVTKLIRLKARFARHRAARSNAMHNRRYYTPVIVKPNRYGARHNNHKRPPTQIAKRNPYDAKIVNRVIRQSKLRFKVLPMKRRALPAVLKRLALRFGSIRMARLLLRAKLYSKLKIVRLRPKKSIISSRRRVKPAKALTKYQI